MAMQKIPINKFLRAFLACAHTVPSLYRRSSLAPAQTLQLYAIAAWAKLEASRMRRIN